MKRRQFVGRVGLGAALVAASEGATLAAGLGRREGHQEAHQDEHHGHASIDGPLATAAVSFGAIPATSIRARCGRFPASHQRSASSTIREIGSSAV
jgi:hypothetical protein